MRILNILLALCLHFCCVSQINLIPFNAQAADQAIIQFDANAGGKELVGSNKVYIHHGVVTNSVNGTAWKYVKGNWGQDDGIGLMTKVSGTTDTWSITFNPNIRSYFNVPANENIFRISCVFRNADGSKKASIPAGNYGWGSVTPNGDIYINLNSDQFVTIKNPSSNDLLIDEGSSLNIEGEASSNVDSMSIAIDNGSGFETVATVFAGKAITYAYNPLVSQNLNIKLSATIEGQKKEAFKSVSITIKSPTQTEDLPVGMKQGVNYDINDPTKATLVLLAPFKEYVYAVGDFSDWKIKEEYQMKRTPDSKYYWLELNGLTPQKQYVYQYWMDGNVKVADPYSEQVADPWNDKFIEPSVFPNLPAYTREDLGIASVLQTNQQKYVWAQTEDNFVRPDVNHLVIYELHLRDFIAAHSLKVLTDTIQYLKRLGINAIELMPLNEFEGNDSWGYNPSMYFALDKYYGKKDDLKKFIEVAHANGLAVILDIVLNHSYGQSPMVQMYFDGGKPSASNPWYNRDGVGQYQWGYDFNHESQYTKDFVDDVNRFWLEEYHFDGYRFDFTKGFTNYAPGGNVDGFDQSRINILKRMADTLWAYDSKAYIILEHWAPDAEEQQLGAHGMKMWRNKSYDFVPITVGNITGSFANTDATTHITLFNSHDERRIAEHCLTEGRSNGTYNIKDSIIMMERVKMAAAFFFIQPGPKMMWQFDELGYDIDINFNGRIGRKPYVWGQNSLKYYNSTNRQHIYTVYKGVLDIRNTITPQVLRDAQKSHALTGDVRRLSYNTTGTDVVVIGNFALTQKSIDPRFTQTGWWYDYFSGDSIQISNVSLPITLAPGEWHIYTTTRLSEGRKDAVVAYSNPVTITPYPFKGSQEIKIRFDATKASTGDTQGLIGADKVYIHSGVNLSTSSNQNLTNVIGNSIDDGIGLMTKVGTDIWEINLTPNVYYGITQGQEIGKIGMWFRDADNSNKGFGFRNSVIYTNVESDLPIVTITPPAFNPDTEITITFDAKKGNRELLSASKVYMHSSVGTENTPNPGNNIWNKVVGNWGLDDGVGLMTKVAGQSDVWQIKLTPKDFYGLNANEFPYWLGAVFRNETGTIKGTGTPGPFENGIIATNLDFFIKNAGLVNVNNVTANPIHITPNPVTNILQIKGIENDATVKVFNSQGALIVNKIINANDILDTSSWPAQMYYIQIYSSKKVSTHKIIKH